MLIMRQSIFNVYTLINPHTGSILSVTKNKGMRNKTPFISGSRVSARPVWAALIGAVIDHPGETLQPSHHVWISS